MPFKLPHPFLPAAEDPDRTRRTLAGAGLGLFSGTLFVLVAGTIDHFAFPQFHMRIDWPHMAGIWLLSGLLMSAWCGLAAWTADPWPGVPAAALGMAMTILITPIAQGNGEGLTNALLLVILMIPLTGVMIPVASLFRWLAGKFAGALDHPGPARFGDITLTLLVAILVGLTPGVLARMDESEQTAVREVNQLLQQGAAASPGGAYPAELGALPGYPARAGKEYTLSQSPSIHSTEGFDVTARFADGYSLTCIVVVYPGRPPNLRSCSEVQP